MQPYIINAITEFVTSFKNKIIAIQILYSANDDLRLSGVGFHSKKQHESSASCPESGA